ncbi:hypothetical protein Tco_0730644 [Tanacetum coccineum]|uniref:PH domain-containing protein n=1 Tax=Tanacetum coccineum TaxID=301880 RepID=A0ABQ4YVE1_9ASTR
MASMNTRLNIEKLDENIIQKHGDSKQVGLKQLGFKQLGQKQVGFKQLGPGVETRFHRVQDEKLAYRRLEDKQPEDKTNTDCLVKEREKVHLGIKVGANITVTGVPGQEGAEGMVKARRSPGPRFEVPARGKDAEYRDREAEVFQVSNDGTAVAQRWLGDKQPEEKTNTDCLVKEQEKVHLGCKDPFSYSGPSPKQEGAEGNVAGKKKVKESMKVNLGKLLKYNAWSIRWSPIRGRLKGVHSYQGFEGLRLLGFARVLGFNKVGIAKVVDMRWEISTLVVFKGEKIQRWRCGTKMKCLKNRNLDNYVLVCDRAKRTTTIPTRYRDEGNVSLSRPSGSKVDDMAAYVFAIAKEEDTHELITFQDGFNSSENDEWVRVMEEEMSSLKKNHTWELLSVVN